MKKIINLLKFFYKSKKIWSKPPKSEILIYDYNLAKYFIQKISNYKFQILYLRGEMINMFILFKLILQFKFKNLLSNYCKLYIEEVQPKIIITGTDNDIKFYDLQNKITKIKFTTVVIQNGHRTLTSPDILNYFDKFTGKGYRADYFLCFNNAIGKIYKEMFNSNYIPIGSFLNNINFSLTKNTNKKNFFWISQFRSRRKVFDEKSLTPNQQKNFKNFDFEEYCSPEKKIIPKIFEFCQKNNLNFKIISSYKSDQSECILEKEFFEKILESSDWEMTINKKKDRLSAYEILSSEAEFVAHIDSTLGYECLSRGIKTIQFLCRESCYPNEKWIFAWPNNFPNTGMIWTDVDSDEEITRLLDYIYQIDNESWQKYLSKLIPDVMEIDPNNEKFEKLIKSLIIKENKA